jgi:hypothetical protein
VADMGQVLLLGDLVPYIEDVKLIGPNKQNKQQQLWSRYEFTGEPIDV